VRITYLVLSAYAMGGTERSAITQANALASDPTHEVSILSVLRTAAEPHYEIDDRVRLRPLIDLAGEQPALLETSGSGQDLGALHAAESRLIPRRWDRQFSALTDIATEHALRDLHADVLITVTPALLASAVQLAPASVVVVHQEHRSSSQRTSGHCSRSRRRPMWSRC
jgi:hypothetical protein